MLPLIFESAYDLEEGLNKGQKDAMLHSLPPEYLNYKGGAGFP